jgi:hypothetical protein
MTKFEVLSINPETKSLERMPFQGREAAESHRQRAEREGRLLVEIISSPEEHEAWQQKSRTVLSF